MKKLVSLIMAILMCMSAPALASAQKAAQSSAATPAPSASARVWAKGLSPAKPFNNVDETDLTKHVGYFMTSPDNDETMPCGIDLIAIYMPRTDLVALAGQLEVRLQADDSVYTTGDLAHAEIKNMSDADLDYFGWGEGTEIDARLDKALAPDAQYYVNIPEGAFDLAQLKVKSAALNGKDSWKFETTSYGLANLQTHYKSEDEIRVGDTVEFDVVLGGDAASAKITLDTPDTLGADVTEFTSNGHATLTYAAAGEYSYTIEFMDKNGSGLGSLIESGEIGA